MVDSSVQCSMYGYYKGAQQSVSMRSTVYVDFYIALFVFICAEVCVMKVWGLEVLEVKEQREREFKCQIWIRIAGVLRAERLTGSNGFLCLL